ncbi:unnamed protein product [Strongylus vulgaris]|uniref:Uncharacterized protein n=1 Tax=Strongylus vulgaris TaxID=40348 RepID=A0A3P7IW51_STRVU|nr:unnamed protein product [Strongylus vulgaris]
MLLESESLYLEEEIQPWIVLAPGAKSVRALEILPKPAATRKPENPWLEWPVIFRIDYGHEEVRSKTGQDPRMYSVSTKGAWKLIEKADNLQVIECDLCTFAMGFVGPEKVHATEAGTTTVIEQHGLKMDPRSNILTPKEKYNSEVAKVTVVTGPNSVYQWLIYVVCVWGRRGQSLVVWAIHKGRQAARQVRILLVQCISRA